MAPTSTHPSPTKTRLNLGCGHEPIQGYVNIDSYAVEADVHGDFRQLTYRDVDEILLSHVLEHLPWRHTQLVLNKLHGWLRDGGELLIEVPDMELITAEAMGNPDWVRYLYGSQEHEGEYHRSGFTIPILEQKLRTAGFMIAEIYSFRSKNPHRLGMPCITAVGVK